MANDFFEFKRFRVMQRRSAMKVGTDGVILGAWCALPENGEDADFDRKYRVLDIGCGTGVISLMAAQRTGGSVYIDAIDIDKGAIADARDNFAANPWVEHLGCCNISLQEFSSAAVSAPFPRVYSHIVSNPPFFVNSLNAPDAARNAARHTDTLSYTGLIAGAVLLLAPDGIFSVILPADSASAFRMEAAGKGLYCRRRLDIITKRGMDAKRIAMEFRRAGGEVAESELVIMNDGSGGYTGEYKKLTSDFYLAF